MTLLDQAVEITKAYAGAGNATCIDTILEKIYKKLVELNKDTENEN